MIVGDRVIVLPLSEYGSIYVGEVGTITRIFNKSSKILFGVKLDNFVHELNKFGTF